jgi:hypothetical protein
MDMKPESMPQIQTEYYLKKADLNVALLKLHQSRGKFLSSLKIAEIRQVKTDDIPMSPMNR